jgi:hypothetical protein
MPLERKTGSIRSGTKLTCMHVQLVCHEQVPLPPPLFYLSALPQQNAGLLKHLGFTGS